MIELEIAYKPAPLDRIAVTLKNSTLTVSYAIEVETGLWSYLGVSWKDSEKSLTIQK